MISDLQHPDNPHVIQAVLFEIELELTNPLFLKRSHGVRRTHTEGCRGHLCRAAEREFSAMWYRRRRLNSGKPTPPDRLADPPPRLMGGVFTWEDRVAVLKWMGIQIDESEPEITEQAV